MFEDRLRGDRFFARIRVMDIECPRCGEVWYCNGKGGCYDARTATFRCESCSLTLQVGVVVFPAKPGHKKPPIDWRPTVEQALALRNQAVGGVHLAERKGWTDPHNIVIREGCRCQVLRRGLIIHPDCPIHGSIEPSGSENPRK